MAGFEISLGEPIKGLQWPLPLARAVFPTEDAFEFVQEFLSSGKRQLLGEVVNGDSSPPINTSTSLFAIEFALPKSFEQTESSGELFVSLGGAMCHTVNTSAFIDCELYRLNSKGEAVGSDLITTDQQDFNSTTATDYAFAVDTDGIPARSQFVLVGRVALNDTGAVSSQNRRAIIGRAGLVYEGHIGL